jgi:microcystin-dependent protein
MTRNSSELFGVPAAGGIAPDWVAGVGYNPASTPFVWDTTIGVRFRVMRVVTAAENTVPPSRDPDYATPAQRFLGDDEDMIGEIITKAVARSHRGYQKISAANVPVSRVDYIRALEKICPKITVNATTGSTIIGTDAADAELLRPGMPIEGAGFVPGTTVVTAPVAGQTKVGYTTLGSNILFAEPGQSPGSITSGEVDGTNIPTDSTVLSSAGDFSLAGYVTTSGQILAARDPLAAFDGTPKIGRRFSAPSVGFGRVADWQNYLGSVSAFMQFSSNLVWMGSQYLNSRYRVGQQIRLNNGVSQQTMTISSVFRAEETIATRVSFVNAQPFISLEPGEYSSAKWPIGRLISNALFTTWSNNRVTAITAADTTHTAHTRIGNARISFAPPELPVVAASANRFVTGTGIPAQTVITGSGSVAQSTHANGFGELISSTIQFAIASDPGAAAGVIDRRVSLPGACTDVRISGYTPEQSISSFWRNTANTIGLLIGNLFPYRLGRRVSGLGITVGSTATAELVPASFTRVCSINSTVTVLTSNTTNVFIGQHVTGTGIPANTCVVAVVPGVSFTLSNAATATNPAVTITFGRVWSISVTPTSTSAGNAFGMGAFFDIDPLTPMTASTSVAGTVTAGVTALMDVVATADFDGIVTLGAQLGFGGSNPVGATAKYAGTKLHVGLNMTAAFGFASQLFIGDVGEWIEMSVPAVLTGAGQTFAFGGSWTLDTVASATSGPNTYSFGGTCTISAPYGGASNPAAQIRIMPYGAGNGVSTFGIPNMDVADRVIANSGPLHAPNTIAGADAHTLTSAESGMPSHAHSVSDPGHGHTTNHPTATSNLSANGGERWLNNGGGTLNNPAGTAWSSSVNTTGISIGAASANASQSHNNIQPTAYVGMASFIYLAAKP